MIKKKIMLIIGGTGFIGHHVAKEALKKKWIVESLSINRPRKKLRIPNIKYILADISKKKFKKQN